MNCPRCQSQISAYVDGELTGQEMLLMRRHLADCSECSQALAEDRQVRGLLAGMARPAAPDHLDARLAQAVLQPARSMPAWQGWGMGAAVAAAAAISAWLVFNSQASGEPGIAPGTSSPVTLTSSPSLGDGSDPLGAYVPVLTVSRPSDVVRP